MSMTKEQHGSPLKWLIKLFAYGSFYILSSASLIFSNKYMMQEENFPYPMVLVSIHQVMITFLSLILYKVRPDLYKSAESVKQNKTTAAKIIIPSKKGILEMLCFLFCVNCVLSNTAYKYLSVSLLQIMKEGNILGIFALGLLTGLEKWNDKVAMVLLGVFVFTVAAVSGDLNFVWYGVIIQLISQLAAITIQTLSQMFMSDRPSAKMKKLDPLTIVGLMAPPSFIILAANLIPVWDPMYLVDAWEWRWVLLPNSILAFSTNLIVLQVIQISSAIHFILIGILKDIFIVFVSSIIFSETLTMFQCFCFLVSIGFIILHALLGLYPNQFELSWSAGLKTFLNDLRGTQGTHSKIIDQEIRARDVEDRIPEVELYAVEKEDDELLPTTDNSENPTEPVEAI